jgi:hypothetical protein
MLFELAEASSLGGDWQYFLAYSCVCCCVLQLGCVQINLYSLVPKLLVHVEWGFGFLMAQEDTEGF